MNDVVVRRLIAVPREDVFAAWLDAETLGAFMRPGSVTAAHAEVDPRVGGRFRIFMLHSGRELEHWGEYLRIDPPALLSFTWHSAATHQQRTVVTVEFLDRGGSTEVVLTHRALPPEKRDEHRGGWTGILAALERVTSRTSPGTA